MAVAVKVPEVGESITEGLLVEWKRQSGDMILVDDPLFELETDKITMTVTAEQAGRLSVQVEAGATVEVGQVVAEIDTDAPPLEAPAGIPQVQAKLSTGSSAPLPDGLSPAVRRLAAEHDLETSQMTGTGRGGRLTKGDVLESMKSPPPPPTPATTPTAATAPPSPPQPPTAPAAIETAATSARLPAEPATTGADATSPRETRVRMSPLRQRIAERMVQAQQTAAILSTFNEVDMSAVIDLRVRLKESFQKQHGVGLGFMSFFVKAVVGALKAVPALNARIDGDEIVQQHTYDIGVAVGSPRGLVVPVVRNADHRSFGELERDIAALAHKAREGALTLPDLSGGVFTISNGGVYGSLLSTPILNPPQSGILGMHAIKKRAVVVDDEVVARPMMYLALSYDHRIVDGEQAVTFLKSIVGCLEQPERLMMEVCGG